MADITTKFIPNCKYPSETPKIITGNTLYTILFITFIKIVILLLLKNKTFYNLVSYLNNENFIYSIYILFGIVCLVIFSHFHYKLYKKRRNNETQMDKNLKYLILMGYAFTLLLFCIFKFYFLPSYDTVLS